MRQRSKSVPALSIVQRSSRDEGRALVHVRIGPNASAPLTAISISWLAALTQAFNSDRIASQHAPFVRELSAIPSHRARAPFDTPATGLHALDNPWQESYGAACVASKVEYECVQAPCSRNFQPLADMQL
jgi:hypothetical protein